MMHLCGFILLLCLSANAEFNAVWRESSENVTLKCSFAGCPSIIEGYDGMYLYLYQDPEERTEVFYYHPYPESTDKITPGIRYTDRIQTSGSLKNHTITISNLTVDDSGFYSCVFIKFPDLEVKCSVYTLFVTGVAPCSRSVEVACALANEKSPPLVLTSITACTISTLLTTIFILLIVPRVKQWMSNSRKTTTGSQVSSDNVYEDMSKNSLHPRSGAAVTQPECNHHRVRRYETDVEESDLQEIDEVCRDCHA